MTKRANVLTHTSLQCLYPRRWLIKQEKVVVLALLLALLSACVAIQPVPGDSAMSGQETAELLGIEPNAVKVRLHRARQALRTRLDRRLRGEHP